MKTLTYVCDNCEDNEYSHFALPKGEHCDCGGHLHLVRQDRFLTALYSVCDSCYYKGDEDMCLDCIHNTKE